MNKKLKTALITTVSILLVIAILVGILWYVSGKKEPVAVSPVAEHLMGYMGEAPSYEGNVSTNNLQAVYLSGTQTVKKVLVTEGQYVEKGTPLFRYDTTLTDIQLERQRIASEQSQLDLKKAKQELEEIKRMKPYSPPPVTRPTTAPTTAPLESVDTLPYFICGNGSEESPYRYLWAEHLDFDREFLIGHLSAQKLECWIAFEVRERCALAGDLISLWGLYVTAEKPDEPLETYPTESETEPTESAPADRDPDPTEEPSEEATEEEVNPEDEWKTWKLSYRFFIPEEIDHVEETTVPTTRETEWVDTSSGYTAAEIAVMKQEKEIEIRDLDLAARMAKLSYESMKQEMNSGIVKATISGTVINLKDEQTAQSSGEPLMQISEGGAFYITIQLGEYDLERYEVGALVTIASWMDYGYTTTGSLVSISQEPTQSGYYGGYGGNSDVSVYEATIVVPAEANLHEGDWEGVTFASDETQGSGVLYLENAYIREENGLTYVYRRNSQGLLEKAYVQTGTVMWGYTEVVRGLTEEDWIAFPYGKDVVDGAPTYEESGELQPDDFA